MPAPLSVQRNKFAIRCSMPRYPSMNRTNSKSTRAPKAAEHRRSPRRWRVGYGARTSARFWSAPAAAALWMSDKVQGPNARSQGRGGAFHEPCVWSPGFSRSGPPEGGTPYRWHDPDGFMVPMHGRRPRGFSMNRTNSQSTREPKAAEHRRTPRRWRVGHRGPKIPALRKAALKTRAVQTLTRGPLTRPQARSVWSASDLSALSLRRGPTVDGPNAQYKSVGLSVLKIIRCKNWRGRLTCKP